MTRQKAEISQARQQIEEKLKRAETLHRELAELGGVVSGHLDEIDGMLPLDDSEFQNGLTVGVEGQDANQAGTPDTPPHAVGH